MQKAKLNVLVAFLAYGGNGNVGMQLPSITMWFAERYLNMHLDDRVGRVVCKTYGDVPLSMERNRIVKDAMEGGFDCILMLDSDNVPDLHLGHRPGARPFWESSFDFLYERKMQGLPTVVCAPYCGPPPHPTKGGQENVYVFYAEQCENQEEGAPRPGIKFTAYTRDHAAMMTGIQPIAAGPTGVILYSTCALELMPRRVPAPEVLEQYRTGEITLERALQIIDRQSWFYYEYTDADQSRKASTEDVTSTREIQMAGVLKHGQPVVFCNWDAWAGHYKPKCVGAPAPIAVESVTAAFLEAVRSNVSIEDRMVELDLPPLPAYEGPVLEMGAESKQAAASLAPEPAGEKVVILGRAFWSPCHQKEDAEAVSELVRRSDKGARAIVLGDRTGELSWAASYQCSGMVVYRIVEPGYADFSESPSKEDGAIKNVSYVDWKFMAKDPQDVDLIIAGTSDFPMDRGVGEARKHLRKLSGALVLVGNEINSAAEDSNTDSELAAKLGVKKIYDSCKKRSSFIVNQDDLWAKKPRLHKVTNGDAAV